MPDTKTEISAQKPVSVSYRDLIKTSLEELFSHMRQNDYTADLVTVPARRLSERIPITPAIAESLMIGISFYMMNTEMEYYKPRNEISGMILPKGKEDNIEELASKLEFIIRKNEWLCRTIEAYLKSRC